MRRLYREQIGKRLRKGDVVGLARHALRYARLRASYALGKPLAGPILGTFITNYSCNLRCKMCDLPLRVPRYKSEGLEPLGTEEIERVLDDFAALGTIGLGFTGGEPLMRKDITTLLARSKTTGMITHLNTNGTFLTPEVLDTVVASTDSVNLSLDGADAATHDAIRGKDGNFQEVLDAAERILAARGTAGVTPRVKLVSVLSNENLDQVDRLIELRREIGADSIDFIPVHDFDTPGSDRERLLPGRNGDDVAARLQELTKTEPIDNSLAHLSLLPRALAGEPSPVRCHAGYNSLVVDLYGRIFPCVPWSNQDRPVGNVRETPLREFWKSGAYAKAREDVKRCRDCYLNCQTELNLLFDPRAPKRPRAARPQADPSAFV